MLIEWLFRKLYGTYEYPFEKADARIARMQDAERKEYYLSAKRIIEEPAYKAEMEEIVRTLYQELSVKTGSKLEQQAYRLSLIMVQKLDGRLRGLSSLYSPPKIDELTRKLN